VSDIVIGSPAWEAGMGPGMKIVALNGRTWTPEVLAEEIQAAKTTTGPIEVTAAVGETVKTFQVKYHDGGKYPHLERVAGRADLLEGILAPKAR